MRSRLDLLAAVLRARAAVPLTLTLALCLAACPAAKEGGAGGGTAKGSAGAAKGTAGATGQSGQRGASGVKAPQSSRSKVGDERPAAKAATGVKTPKKTFALSSKETSRASFLGVASARLRKIVSTFPKVEQRPVAAPLSLTTSDGTGLELLYLSAKVVLEGPLAFTQLHLVFKNPRPRTIEGRFSITLPPKAVVSRLAMRMPHGWMEAEVVERQRARRIYEDFLHRRQDPALLEKKAGNQFRARIFPIAANSDKEIIISFSQQLEGADTPYRLPLKGLPKMQELAIQAYLAQATKTAAATSLGGTTLTQKVVKVEKENYKPDRDFVVQQPSGAPAALRKGHLAVVRIAPKPKVAVAPPKGLLVLVDTSASRAAGFASMIERLGVLLRTLRKNHGDALPFQLSAFDQTISTIYRGTLGELKQEHLAALLARQALGASDLHGALQWASKVEGFDRLLLVSDVVVTAGETDHGALKKAAGSLKANFQRMDVLVTGGIRDEVLAAKLVRGNLPRDGVVLDDRKPAEALAARIGKATVSNIEVSIPGAKWVWPSRLDGVQPGDEVLVYADLSAAPADKAPIAVRLVGGIEAEFSVPWATVKGPLLQRAWVAARIAKLGEKRDALGGDRDLREAINKQIVSLSVKNRVLCDKTALLVLETEYDYRRYGINRTALADILVVGHGGLEVKNRKQIVLNRPRVRSRSIQTIRGISRKGRGVGRSSAGRSGSADGASGRTRSPRRKAKRRARRRGAAPGLGDLATIGGGGGGVVSEDRRSAPAAKSVAPVAAARPAAPPPKAAGRSSAPSGSASGRLSLRSRPAPARVAPSADPAPQREVRRPRRRPRRRASRRRPPRRSSLLDGLLGSRRPRKAPWTGRFAAVMKDLQRGRAKAGLEKALVWRNEKPGDVLALVAMGEALSKLGELQLAARAYGSIIDLYPSRADLRRFAGQRLELLGKYGQALAADSFTEALAQRPDHPNSHRMLAWALVRLGHYEDAFVVISKGLQRNYPRGRFRGVGRIMREDQGLIAAAWIAAEPKRRAQIDKMLELAGARPDKRPSLRFILSWETDSNDVDFHIHNRSGHASYRSKHLPSGGDLYADVTTGYGPECFAIYGAKRAFPYRTQLHYYRRGPMGYGMGRLQIIQHDGKGKLSFRFRPFVVMRDGAYVDLGKIRKAL